MQYIYPDLYRIDDLTEENGLDDEEFGIVPQTPRLQLSWERIAATGMYLLDAGDSVIVYVCRGVHQYILERIFGVTRLVIVFMSVWNFPFLQGVVSF